jgi:hypothetical protein
MRDSVFVYVYLTPCNNMFDKLNHFQQNAYTKRIEMSKTEGSSTLDSETCSCSHITARINDVNKRHTSSA